jgi:hypothetical protein
MKKPTQATFQPHLIAVLGTLTDFVPGVAVPMGETYAPICERLGISEDEYGNTSDGKYVVTHRLIGLAMRTMRDKGLGEYAKKGHWTLTAAGCLESQSILGIEPEIEAEPEPEVPVAMVAKVAAVEVEEFVIPPEPESKVVHLPVQKPVHPYSDDPYIRSLGISQIKCFGAHSARSSTCKTCPLKADCLQAVSVNMAHIAALLDAGDDPQEIVAKATEATEIGHAIDQLIESVDTAPEEPGDKFVITKAMVTTTGKQKVEQLCSHCMKTISQGSDGVWIHSKGVFHPGCVTMEGSK